MSAQEIRSMIAQPIDIDGTVAIGNWTHSGGASGSASLQAGVYRLLLGLASGLATEESPQELLSALSASLSVATGHTWLFSLRADGFVGLTVSGATPATLTWHAGNVVRNLLGYTGNLTGLGASPYVSTYHPTHVAYGLGRSDSDWIADPGEQAAARTKGGKVYAIHSGRVTLTKTVRLGFLPRDWSTRQAKGAAASPALPDSTSRMLAPRDTAGLAPPWSWHDLVHSSAGRRLGLALGNFQTLVATPGVYEVGMLDPETISSDSAQSRQRENWDPYRQQEIRLVYQGTETMA